MSVSTPLLDRIDVPEDLRRLRPDDLPQLADELRAEIIDAAAQTGGHFGAGLGVVELTVALHYVFETPRDRLIWDVSHQAYPHKILTGRRDRIRSIRQRGGLYGFTKRTESDYDPFGAAHSSTSISSALGMAVGRDMKGEDKNVVAVIGDGAMSAGMAYEAMNNAGALDRRMIIILNDNGMSIAPAVGALNNCLRRFVSDNEFVNLRDAAACLAERFPDVYRGAESRAETRISGKHRGTLFEQLGLTYIGPIDGHDMTTLVPVLQAVRDANCGPILLHAVTEKGRGHPFAAPHRENYHAVGKFDPKTGAIKKAAAKAPSYTSVFADALIEEADRDPSIVAVTAAMPSGTGVDRFAERFPDRAFDVGIAEQHAVTFAAGLACEGMKPFAAIYSTFLQRAYDQIVHDVALQSLPVRFAIDRAGLVGADGATHAGSFDVTYLGCLPNMVVMAAADEAELKHMVATARAIEDRPSAFRYPRGEGCGVVLPERGEVLPIGKGRLVRDGDDVAILNLGGRLSEAMLAAEQLDARGVSVTVADARFAKPLDTDLLTQLVRHHRLVLTLEEGAVGGFSAHVLTYLAQHDLLSSHQRVRSLTLPDRFVPHGSPKEQYQDAGLDAASIVTTVLAGLDRRADLREVRAAGA